LHLTARPKSSIIRLSPAYPFAGVGVYSMHPGWADTEGVRTSIPGFHKAFKDKLRTPEEGVDTIVWLALEVRGRITKLTPTMQKTASYISVLDSWQIHFLSL
jgi:hypothetical protein